MVTIRPRPIADYVDALRLRRPFTLSRWGDGEWQALLGQTGRTCDGQVYSGALRTALTQILLARPRYRLALGPMALRRLAVDVDLWLQRRGLIFDWDDAGLWARAVLDGTIRQVVDALAARTVILVGPQALDQLQVFPIAQHVVCPARNAFDVVDALTDAAIEALGDHSPADPVVAICAGPAAKIVAHRLWLADPTATIVDFGSVWDPYAGRQTRTYHARVAGALP